MTAIVRAPFPLAEAIPEVRISAASVWLDHVWQLDVTIPGTAPSDVLVDWGFVLPDGSHFTEDQWTPWRDAAKRFLWSLRVDPPSGHRRARDSSLVRSFKHLRILIFWMTGEGYRCFADLDHDAAESFLATVKARPGRKRQTLSASTFVGYARLLNSLYLQRDRLPDAPKEDLLAKDRLGLLAGRWGHRGGSLPCTPDAVAIPLVCAAIRLIGSPADDIITLRDRAQAAVVAATAQRLDRRGADAFVGADLADFIFSTPVGEERPWRTERVADLAAAQFLVSRLYDACFVVIAYLIGARVSEILGLKVGCIVDHPSADGAEAFAYLSGRVYKTADCPGGQPHRWVAPAPVVRAIAVLEGLSEPVRRSSGRADLWLLPSQDGGFHVPRSSNLIDRLNGSFAVFIELPTHNGQVWHLTPHQGRKTFARFVGRRDRTGLHALAAHFGHVTRTMTDASYVGTDFELSDLIEAEALEEMRDALEELLTAPRLAGKAGRTIAERSRFRGRTRQGDVREYVEFILRETDMRLGTCDWGYCVYRRESSACLGGERGPNPVLRTQSICADCANFVVSEKHRPIWAARRQRNVDLLTQPALDMESRALAAARVEECDRILIVLDQVRGDGYE
ncbi:integrase [Methylocella tundrae]|uniref:Integrase n=1 Tax=Methylocella tundrae TaxID=227605 RepID=A0A4U8Z7K1_METTU|nr:integrase [Methylocella tundrae]WPP02781.1 integrase [Methylocella tundrae]VFU17573.1 Integrase [Methylocella tundrae]